LVNYIHVYRSKTAYCEDFLSKGGSNTDTPLLRPGDVTRMLRNRWSKNTAVAGVFRDLTVMSGTYVLAGSAIALGTAAFM
jgi:hypothetical protein